MSALIPALEDEQERCLLQPQDPSDSLLERCVLQNDALESGPSTLYLQSGF